MQHAPAVARPHAIRRPARLLRLASDERLVAFVRGGDEGAFEAIYDRHHRAILGFCRHMLGVREEAEDAVQHTFLAAYRDLLGSEKPIELKAWLFAIARNRCLSILRARREHVELAVAEPSTDGLAATVQRREDVRELLGDLARLPEEQRAALLLSELGALDHEGIAAALGCRREKVKALVFQARSSLAADRQARAIPCEQIRTELASASGSALRRGPLRRHVRDCPGCRAFQSEVARQRKLMAIALPVLPTAALKAASLGHGAATAAAAHAAAGPAGGGLIAGGAAGTTGGAAGGLGGALGALGSAGAVKVALSVAAAAALAGGGAATIDAVSASHRATSSVTTTSPATGHSGTTPSGAPPVAGTTPPRSASAHGFLPKRAAGAGGNGAAARAFARTRAPGGAAGRVHGRAHAHVPRASTRAVSPSPSRSAAPSVHAKPTPTPAPHVTHSTAPPKLSSGATSTTDGTTPQGSPRSDRASSSTDG
jgi:RNA polymerase sigma factor (sigma-70 family)